MTVPDPLTAIPAPKEAVPPEIVNPTMLPAGPIVTAVPPGAAIVVCDAPPVLTTLTALLRKSIFSGYVPGETETVSPDAAALRAAWIVGNSPGTVSTLEAKAFASNGDRIATARPTDTIPQSQRILMFALQSPAAPLTGTIILTGARTRLDASRPALRCSREVPGLAQRAALDRGVMTRQWHGNLVR